MEQKAGVEGGAGEVHFSDMSRNKVKGQNIPWEEVAVDS